MNQHNSDRRPFGEILEAFKRNQEVLEIVNPSSSEEFKLSMPNPELHLQSNFAD